MEFNQQLWKMAFSVAQASEDDSTKVGAVLAARTPNWRNPQNFSTGYNRFPTSVQRLPERTQRPLKYEFTLHAEMDALIQLVLQGSTPVLGYMYSTQIPCPACMVSLVTARVTHIFCPDPSSLMPKWYEGSKTSLILAAESGIKIIYKDVPTL